MVAITSKVSPLFAVVKTPNEVPGPVLRLATELLMVIEALAGGSSVDVAEGIVVFVLVAVSVKVAVIVAVYVRVNVGSGVSDGGTAVAVGSGVLVGKSVAVALGVADG